MNDVVDPWNPTADEIRRWAGEPGAFEPVQDWDLSLAYSPHHETMLSCVADDTCPNRRYLLGALYLTVGEAVRTEFDSLSRADMDRLLELGDRYPHPDIARWHARSRALLANPASFDYELWCLGGYVTRDAHGN